MYYVFPSLPPINSNSLPSEIETWKHHPHVTQCHKKLFHNTDTEGTSTFMSKILDKVWPSKKTAPKVHIAYAIGVCEFLLNPTNKRILVTETPMKFRIQKYLQKNINKEKFNSDDSNDDGVSSEKQQECGEESSESSEKRGGDKIVQIQEEEEEVQEGSGIEDDDYFSSEDEKRRAQSLRRKYRKQI